MSVLDIKINDGVALLLLQRPETLNALNPPLVEAVTLALAELAANAEVKAIVISGSGRGFCAGADLVSFLSQAAAGRADIGQKVADSMENSFNPMMAALMDFPKPVVSAVNGVAAGGGAALAICADIVLAGRSAIFKIVQVPQLGCVADLGGNWLLSRMAGRATALGAVLLGEPIGAEKAEKLGLIWEMLEDDALIPRALELARRLAAIPRALELARRLAAIPRGLALASRRLVDAGATMNFRDILDLERLYQHEFASRPQLVDTIAAFMQGKGKG